MSTLEAILQACGQLLISKEATRGDDVDRAQIRQQLAMTPDERLASVSNTSKFLASARLVD